MIGKCLTSIIIMHLTEAAWGVGVNCNIRLTWVPLQFFLGKWCVCMCVGRVGGGSENEGWKVPDPVPDGQQTTVKCQFSPLTFLLWRQSCQELEQSLALTTSLVQTLNRRPSGRVAQGLLWAGTACPSSSISVVLTTLGQGCSRGQRF